MKTFSQWLGGKEEEEVIPSLDIEQEFGLVATLYLQLASLVVLRLAGVCRSVVSNQSQALHCLEQL